MVVADDDNVTIAISAKKADSQGDLGYVLTIANKTPGKVYAYSGVGCWKVRGSEVDDPVLYVVVEPGQEVDEFMWFDRGSLGSGSLDALQDVEGVIVVQDYDTAAIMGEYAFAA